MPALAASLALGSGCVVGEDSLEKPEIDLTSGDAQAVTLVSPFIVGDLGSINLPTATEGVSVNLFGIEAAEYSTSAASFLHSFALDHLQATGAEDFEVFSVRQDERGQVGIRFNEVLNGIQIKGAQLVVHADATSGAVNRVNGHFVPSQLLPTDPALSAEEALNSALQTGEFGIAGTMTTDAELSYVLTAENEVALAWSATVEYENEEGPQRDIVFADAMTGEVAARHPQIYYARTMRTSDCNEGFSCNTVSSSPDAINTGDLAIDSAHNYAIATYNYFLDNHNRDSLDGNGMTLRSRVHYDRNYNNAFWDGFQMTYGDGDGTTFVPLSQDADVVAHELTHGVTEHTSGLIYRNESGALNEAMSDIFGAMVDRQEGATGADIWLVGEDIYTPGTDGDALRDMADPQSQGDYDYYPTRYTGPQDNGGVHWNSGIANLAFKLLVGGGTHPRGTTSNVVPGIGFDKAAQIFYFANAHCLTPSSNFEAARNCTAQGATTMYGQEELTAVHQAWDAVGVPGSPGNGGGGGGGGGRGELENGVAETGLGDSKGNEKFYTFEVPEGARNVSLQMSGGSGDADLYVRFGAAPTINNYDCRPYRNGNSETCDFATPGVGTYHVMVRAYSTFADVSLVASYERDEPGACTPLNESVDNLSGARGATDNYTLDVPACASTVSFQIAGGSGDADLYVRHGSAPSTGTYDCRPYKDGNNEVCSFTPPTAGTYHIMLRGYSAYSGVTLNTSYE